MNTAEATRQIYWNISHIWVMYALLLPVLVIAGYGIYRHVRLWRRGAPLARFDHPADRVRLLLKQALVQQSTARDAFAGWFHRLIFYGFIVLAIATTIVALDADAGFHIMHGGLYLYFQSFIVDVFGALVLVGVAMAAIRRFAGRPKKLVYTKEAAWIPVVIFVIVATGFLLEGLRIAATGDPWAAWSPIGNLAASILRGMMGKEALEQTHRATWWFHLAISFGFIAWAPYTKMMHVLTGPLNIYTANLVPIGAALKNVDFESSASFGVNSLAAFTWKDLLDLDACTECGRCTSVCPANTVGKELSPRDLILDLRKLMHERTKEAFGPGPESQSPAEASATADQTSPAGEAVAPPAIIGAVPGTSPERLWQCTTCAACVDICPVLIEQMPKIVDMRRYQVMEQSDFPDSMQAAITSLESRSHPFPGTQASRLDWADGLGVAQLKDCKTCEVLLWVGCAGALLERNQKVMRATARVLQAAGVNFAILGREEKCCGDPARRIGNEFQFEAFAKDNIAMFGKYGVAKIVTTCPHCFNTLKNEYPHFEGNFEVRHHTEFIADLVMQGKLQLSASSDKKVVFHDPCYLGRHNGIYDAPRNLLRAASRTTSLELERNRASSFCCGGGGGMSFVEEPPTQRVNQERAREVLDTQAEVAAVACPFCLTMMEDGINALKGERELRVKDIAELLAEALPTAESTKPV
jgi:Fe-S oxidoreductase